MEKQLTVDAVTEFLKENPEFLNNWLSSRGLSELADERNRKPASSAQVIGNAFVNYLQNVVQRKRVPQAKVIYNEVNKNDLFKELVRDIADELDVNILCHKILQNVCILTRSDRGSLFLVRRSLTEQYLVSKLFDVTTTSLLDESLHSTRDAIHIQFGEGIVGTVAETRKSINIKDAYNDPRFNKEIDVRTGYYTRCMMALPIFGLEEEVVGVACVVNKLDGDYFTAEDEKVFRDYLAFCGIGINNAQLFEIKVEEFKRNQLLLHLVRQITRELGNLKKLVEVILQQAISMLDCKGVSVYLLDINNLSSYKFSNVFELTKSRKETTDCINNQKYASLARKCIMNGEVVYNPTVYDVGKNILDVEDLLCINIMNAASACIGCIIFDRDSKDVFSRSDLEMMETFALFCGIGLQNAQNYEVAFKSEAQKQIALDVLANHSIAPQNEVDRLMSFKMLTLEKLNIYQFDFNDMLFNDDETVLVCVRLFLELNTLKLLDIDLELLYLWVMTVQKNYRDVIYHNWRHGINVAQTMFCMLTTGKMNKYFTNNECVYLMVASLCHDLDHRGTNNAFQVKVASPLATLYSTSVMEHHHIDRCLMIINADRTNIFKNLSADEYTHAIKLVEHAILSTDLVAYFEKRNQFKHLVENGEKTFCTDEYLDLLLSMMMTACDLSAITKPWKVQRKVALIVAREFYSQGDMEKQIEETVIPLMDRDKRHDLPKMQVSFIDFVCVMVYKYMAEMNELLTPLFDGCMANRENWGDIASGKVKFDVDKRISRQELSNDFFLRESSDDEEQEVPEKKGEEQERNGIGGGGAANISKEVIEEEAEYEEEEETAKEEEEKANEEKKKADEEKEKAEEGEEKAEEGEEEEEKAEEEEEADDDKKKEEEEEKKKAEEEKKKAEEEEKKRAEEEKKRAEEEKKRAEEEKKRAEEEKKRAEEEKKKAQEGTKDDTPTTAKTETEGVLPELKSRRTYRQPKHPVLQRKITAKPCYDELAEENQKRIEKRRTVYKPTDDILPLRIKRTSTVVVPPNPIRTRPTLIEDSQQSFETQRLQRLSTFNEYSSSSSWSGGEEESSEITPTSKTESPVKEPLVRKLTTRTSRMQMPQARHGQAAYAAIAEGDDDEDEDVVPEIQRRVTRRVTGPTRYMGPANAPKRYITK